MEPPGLLKRLFSVPKNVRRTAAVGDVVVPVIGARDNWGGIRQASEARQAGKGVVLISCGVISCDSHVGRGGVHGRFVPPFFAFDSVTVPFIHTTVLEHASAFRTRLV